MTVTTDTIEAMSDYVLGVDYTSTQFSLYKTWAEKQYETECSGLDFDADREDEMVALLICHRIARKSIGSNVMQSESMMDYSYSVNSSLLTSTRWLEEYRKNISEASAGITAQESTVPSRGVLRSDYQTSKSFKISPTKLPSMRYTDSTLKEPE
jgi:hypothetical protein